MSLSPITLKSAKSREKPYKLADEKDLYLLINPNDSKYWKLKYRQSLHASRHSATSNSHVLKILDIFEEDISYTSPYTYYQLP